MVSGIRDHQQAVKSVEALLPEIEAAGNALRDVIRHGNRVFICGNGGSAADAQHFAAELTGRFRAERRGFPAVALTTDTSALTAIGNDYGFDQVFARQLESLAGRGDQLVAISTSGNSGNVIAAVRTARDMGVSSLALLGRGGGELASLVDRALVVPAQATPRIQEAHILIIHLLCEMFEPQ